MLRDLRLIIELKLLYVISKNTISDWLRLCYLKNDYCKLMFQYVIVELNDPIKTKRFQLLIISNTRLLREIKRNFALPKVILKRIPCKYKKHYSELKRQFSKIRVYSFHFLLRLPLSRIFWIHLIVSLCTVFFPPFLWFILWFISYYCILACLARVCYVLLLSRLSSIVRFSYKSFKF